MRFRVHSAFSLLWLVAVLGFAGSTAAQPPAPTKLVATPFWSESENEGRVRLDWEYPDSRSPRFSPAWEYQYRYRPLTGTYPQDGRPDGWAPGWTDLTGDTPGQFPSGAARTGTVLNLTRQGFYEIRLRVKAGGGSRAGAHATADEVAVSSSPELPPIARVVATGGDGFVTLDWRDYPPLTLSTGHEVRWDWRRRVVGGPWGPFLIRDVPGEPCGIDYPLSLPATVRRIELRNVQVGVTYEYQLRIRRARPVFNDMDERIGTECFHGRVSPTSNSVTPAGSGSLQPPTALEVTSTRAGTLTIRWQPPNPPPYQYLVQWIVERPGPDGRVDGFWQDAGTPRGTTTELTISGLTDGEPYTVRVCSQGPNGTPDPATESNWRQYCAVAQGTAGLPNKPPELGPVKLEDLTLTVNSAYVVSLVGVFTDPDGDTLTYTAQSSDPAVVSVSGPAHSTSFTVSALKVGSARITVVARDEANPTRPAAVQFNVIVEPAPPNLYPPTALVVTSPGPDQLQVAWTAPTRGDRPGRYWIGYLFQRDAGDEGVLTASIPAGTPTNSPFVISGLTGGEPYTIVVCSQTADGRPAYGDDPGAPPYPCASAQGTPALASNPPAPAGVTANLTGIANIRVDWTP